MTELGKDLWVHVVQPFPQQGHLQQVAQDSYSNMNKEIFRAVNGVHEHTAAPALRGHSPEPFGFIQIVKQYTYCSVSVSLFAEISFQNAFFTDKYSLFFRCNYRRCIFSHEIQREK